jgi:hypothetical protein
MIPSRSFIERESVKDLPLIAVRDMLKPLIINRPCFFDQSPGGECLRAFLNAMDKNEWEPVVYASDRTPLVRLVQDNVKLVHEKRYIQYIAAAIRRVLVPDLTWLPGYEWWSWGKDTVNSIIKDFKSGTVSPDFIHSVAYPVASHWVALKVKKATGLPWVMQFYDPWADNPYRPFRTKWLKKRDWVMERECVEAADLIIHNNQSIVNLWKERYGEEIGKKIVALPLTVPMPSTEVVENKHKRGELLTISHIGNFMLNRTSQPFIRAISVLISRHPEYKVKLKVNYIGMVTDPEKELIKMNGLSDVFNLTGSISADACMEYYKNTDLFLAVDGVNKDNLFFPSKILKYLYFRRPILGITPIGSVLDGELQQSGHTSIDNSDIESIVEYLERAMADYESLMNFNHDYWKRFEPTSVVEQYKELVSRFK